MIKIENYEVMGWEHAIRGMRNPMNSWEKSDSWFNIDCDSISCSDCPTHCRSALNCVDALNAQKCKIGPNDHDLMMRLASAGPVHGKFRRMITVYVDITAPLYWWKEFDTYKVGTVANSCSTMHKIHAKEFTLEDFSCEHLIGVDGIIPDGYTGSGSQQAMYDYKKALEQLIVILNSARDLFLETKDKKYWWQMIQLLPSSYNQKRTVQLNYEVLANIYEYRKDHKLDEWREVCKWIESLPYSEIILGYEPPAN